MSDTEPKKTETQVPEASTDAPEKQKPTDLILRIREALDAKEGEDSLHNLGNLFYEKYGTKEQEPGKEEYSAAIVLSSIKEVYDEYKDQFDPTLEFVDFLKSFGAGMIKLCQQKLLEVGDYNLGKSGEQKNGVDGKLGKRTLKALIEYYGLPVREKTSVKEDSKVKNIHDDDPDSMLIFTTDFSTPLPPEESTYAKSDMFIFSDDYKPESIPEKKTKSKSAPEDTKEDHQVKKDTHKDDDHHHAHDDIYEPGDAEKILTPKAGLHKEVTEIYNRHQTMFFNGYNGPKENMHEKFGKTEKEVQRYITKIDPITKGPVTFLGKPLAGGINLMMLPFLKIAEEEIEKSGVNYIPDGKAIGGFDFRDMKVQGKPSGYPSFHKFGLAIDIDAFQNMPRHDRGTIPDQVVMAMVKNGFASGLVAHPDFTYLSADPMHFQLRFPPESEQGQEIINASAVGIQYWEAVKPLLEAIA